MVQEACGLFSRDRKLWRSTPSAIKKVHRPTTAEDPTKIRSRSCSCCRLLSISDTHASFRRDSRDGSTLFIAGRSTISCPPPTLSAPAKRTYWLQIGELEFFDDDVCGGGRRRRPPPGALVQKNSPAKPPSTWTKMLQWWTFVLRNGASHRESVQPFRICKSSRAFLLQTVFNFELTFRCNADENSYLLQKFKFSGYLI